MYCAGTAALAVLEARVHLDLPLDLLPDDYVMMKVEAADDLAIRTIMPSDLPSGWRSREDLCRPIADHWLATAPTTLLSVPSARPRGRAQYPHQPTASRCETERGQ
jgi:RES domain